MAATGQPQLLAAADRVELVPPPGGQLGGFASRIEPLTGSLDRLFARILLLQLADTRILWVSCDLLGLSTALDREFRQHLAGTLSMPVGSILISCTHTHSAPVAMPARGPSGIADLDWLRRDVFHCVTRVAAGLPGHLEPVSATRLGTTTVSGLGYNRQDARFTIDETLLTLSLAAGDGRAIATVVNYAMHPVVIGARNLQCSADYPGHLCSKLEAALGGVAMFIQGSCGDVDPVIYRDVGRDAGTVSHLREIGQTLADAAIGSLRTVEVDSCYLAIASATVRLPLDLPPSLRELTALRDQLLRERGAEGDVPMSPSARGAMFQLAWADELLHAIQRQSVPRSLPAEISALRIGGVLVVAFPFEIYSQIGLELRRQLAPQPLIISAYTHGLVGYVVTAAAKAQGGYGAALSYRYFPELLTAISEGAGDLLVAQGVALAREIEHRRPSVARGA